MKIRRHPMSATARLERNERKRARRAPAPRFSVSRVVPPPEKSHLNPQWRRLRKTIYGPILLLKGRRKWCVVWDNRIIGVGFSRRASIRSALRHR